MNRTFLLGIAGGTCSGKSTAARLIASRLEDLCTIVPLDNYYRVLDLSLEERALVNHDKPDVIDWPLLREHLFTLLSGHAIEMPVYSFRHHIRTDRTQKVSPADLLILEGIHAFHDADIYGEMALRIFIDSTREQRRERRLKRDLRERSDDYAYTANKFENQTEKTFTIFESRYRAMADIICQSPKDALNLVVQWWKQADGQSGKG